MMSRNGFQVQFVGHTLKDGHVEYQIEVTDPDGDSWLIQRRYREIRELHDIMKLKHPQSLQSFPAKRLFGNTDPIFIQQRQTQLQHYLSMVISLEPSCEHRSLRNFLEIRHKASEPQTLQPSSENFILTVNDMLIDLSQSPQPLDLQDVLQRQEKYASVVADVAAHPLDPLLLNQATQARMPQRPLKWGPEGRREVWANKCEVKPLEAEEDAAMGAVLDELSGLLDTERSLEGVDALILPFPEILLQEGQASAAAAE
uniref:PX domain-containing protein n=1 Tax=Chromera velia CCMP2878 TaxID=1169474 RepID=A0A0K6S9I1_9ALVE|eukprot:Cvel_7414.t2-p1 / transcript=Cvel_7414.t2 / gene=Cvel_7414 / organism=Chromera_velia_CCMP2878 / gene_product=Kinesin-like protein KIF16B, putative / transcript_product=Kinesin-like protein KIF16B, putative / location=Cvel_scaffold387:28252-31872(+) / protein_length=256 / sequence_SO=supercontig / SO=protein_coding / is_pseudo=false